MNEISILNTGGPDRVKVKYPKKKACQDATLSTPDHITLNCLVI